MKNELKKHVDYWVDMDKIQKVTYDKDNANDMENLEEHFTMAFDDLTDQELKECVNLYLKKMNMFNYVDGLKCYLENSKLARIDDFAEFGSRTELFELLKQEKINFIEPFGIYINEFTVATTVPDDCIYCEDFFIDESEPNIE